MHPAHIDLKGQPLDKYKEGEIYTLRVRELAGTQWETIKSSDQTDRTRPDRPTSRWRTTRGIPGKK